MDPLALAACLLSAGPIAREGEGGMDGKRLQGSWTVVLGRRDAKPADDLLGHRVIFTDHRFIIRTGDGRLLYEGTYKTDMSNELAHIDFRHTDGLKKGVTWLGALSVDADTMTICDNAADPQKARPSRFWPTDTGYVTVVLKRDVR